MSTESGTTPSLSLRLGLAGLSAVAAQLCCQPIETIKIRLQLRDGTDAKSKFRNYGSFRSGARAMVATEGLSALWKGMLPSALREMSYSSLRYGLFIPIQSMLPTNADNSVPTWARFTAGGLSGGIGAAIANPTDLLKARMQADTSTQPRGFMQHVADIYRTAGLRGFYLGVGTTVSRAVVLGATNLGTYSTAKAYLKQVMHL